ncbi:unknown [Salmonella phage FelixO1]|uniref:Uncharacterized protein n=1 Tax=Salmonella phage Felix O1 (isolate Felix O1-VT1) TaxID=1283336 RepID=Q6KGA2_BPFO1|nr:unknown [Salmonella phage FelixO1]
MPSAWRRSLSILIKAAFLPIFSALAITIESASNPSRINLNSGLDRRYSRQATKCVGVTASLRFP